MEFISVKDLPEATGTNTNLLCMENDELKQIPSAKIGGGDCDLKIRIYVIIDDYGNYNYEGEILSGSFGNVVDKITSREVPNVIVIEDYLMDEEYPAVFVTNSNAVGYQPNNTTGETNIVGIGYNCMWTMFENGTIIVSA